MAPFARRSYVRNEQQIGTDFLSDTDYGALLVRRTSIETYGNLLDEKAQFLVDAVRVMVV